MNQLLVGKIAIVTGASRGLGKEIAQTLAAAGATLFLTARNAAALGNPRDNFLAVDLTAANAPEQIVAACVQRFGGVDILINNAGILGPIGPLESVPFADWQSAFVVNLFAPSRLCQLVAPIMRQRGGGKIINLSGGGATSPRPDFTAYGASKCALVRLTETLAIELADANIDVNAVAPGAMNTDMASQVIAAGPTASRDYAAAVQRAGLDTTETIRNAAELVAFLASPACDGITGRLISAAWDDWRTLPEMREELARTDRFTLRRIK
ncbi:MAG TPA: SDR family oxidoreductase [Tepidisphaeraceae bacterium]|jgi:3-oxoacyl-[acyl-carrier protein] reductase|nr:SDR family oxidoreductase [Tepidisphaeraceae bacterium]